MENLNKTRKISEKDFLTKVFFEFLKEKSLIVETSFSGKSYIITKSKNDKLPYEQYVEYVNGEKIDNISVHLDIQDLKNYKNYDLKKEDCKNLSDIHEKKNKIFIYEYFDLIKENTSAERFIAFLDKKNSKSTYNAENNTKFILNYLQKNAPHILFPYINRNKFLTSNHDNIHYIFSSFIKTQEQRKSIFNNLISVEVLKNSDNNRNKFFKILNDFIAEKDEYDEYFSNIRQSQKADFLKLSEQQTITIDINLEALMSFNLKNKEYTSKEQHILILNWGVEELKKHKESLGFDYIFNNSNKNHDNHYCLYITGPSPNKEVILTVFNEWLLQALEKKEISEIREVNISEARIINLSLNNTITPKEEVGIQKKIKI